MPTPTPSTRRWSLDALPASERQQVVDLACALSLAAGSGRTTQALRGKNVAVLCEHPDCPCVERFRRVAGGLGARVTLVRPSEALTRSPHAPDAVGSLLGRLYDAIDCHDLAPEVVERLVQSTGRPVFNELSCQSHVSGAGAAPCTSEADADYAMQAMLIRALA